MDTAFLVEPQKEHRRKFSGLLEEEGLRVESFASAEEAVRQVKRVAPVLLIVDVNMPSMSGLATLERLKNQDFSVLFITAHRSAAIKHGLYSLGDVAEAPVSNQEFRARVRGMLKRRSRRIHRSEKNEFSAHPIAAHVLAELHDPDSGRLDAGRIAAFLGVPLTAFAEFCDMSVAGLHKSPASASLQESLIPIARSVTILSALLGSREAVRTWMNSPHPDLGGRPPIRVIEEGKGGAVSEMLESALAGQPS
jgi:CheY-like chemotaxis protein